jgi:hypothetical protein
LSIESWRRRDSVLISSVTFTVFIASRIDAGSIPAPIIRGWPRWLLIHLLFFFIFFQRLIRGEDFIDSLFDARAAAAARLLKRVSA